MGQLVPPGVVRSEGHELFGCGYVGDRQHRCNWHGHGVGGNARIAAGHSGHRRDMAREVQQLHIGARIGSGPLGFRVGGAAGPEACLALQHGWVWIFTRTGAGELGVLAAADPWFQGNVETRISHCVPPLPPGTYMFTAMAKVGGPA